MQRILTNSRWALEKASETVMNKWMKDLFFMMSCRRLIMLNLLDRELGTFGVLNKPGPEANRHFDHYAVDLKNTSEQRPANSFMRACEQEEFYLKNELNALLLQPGLPGRTRQLIANLLNETAENLNDLRFVKVNVPGLRA
ncbi:MAG TPA: hypothetical protein VKG92_09735 [Flavobacteriales bacterium]|nr:hypothetical protein [Flavobacteriales bacterium]